MWELRVRKISLDFILCLSLIDLTKRMHKDGWGWGKKGYFAKDQGKMQEGEVQITSRKIIFMSSVIKRSREKVW